MRRYSKKTKVLGFLNDHFYWLISPIIMMVQVALIIPFAFFMFKDRGSKIKNYISTILYWGGSTAISILPWVKIDDLACIVEDAYDNSKAKDEGKIHLVTDED